MAMVPPAAAAASAYAPYLALGDFVMAHRSELAQGASSFASRAARRASQWAKRNPRVRRKRTTVRRSNIQRVGFHPSEVSAVKTFTGTDFDATNQAIRTLYTYDITSVPKGTTNDIDMRQRDQVYLNGIKILMSIKNTSPDPLHLNVAVLMNKQDPSGAISATDFFRGSGDTRSVDFNPAILNSNDFRARPVNTDKNVILMHQRYTLATDRASNAYEPGFRSSYVMLDKYVPIKRVITYDGNAANTKIWLVYWMDNFNNIPGAVIGNRSEVSIRCITNFKEPKINY